MPRIEVRTRADATVEEVWVLDVTHEQHEAISEDPNEVLDLLNGERLVHVYNDKVYNEGDREVMDVKRVGPS